MSYTFNQGCIYSIKFLEKSVNKIKYNKLLIVVVPSAPLDVFQIDAVDALDASFDAFNAPLDALDAPFDALNPLFLLRILHYIYNVHNTRENRLITKI